MSTVWAALAGVGIAAALALVTELIRQRPSKIIPRRHRGTR